MAHSVLAKGKFAEVPWFYYLIDQKKYILSMSCVEKYLIKVKFVKYIDPFSGNTGLWNPGNLCYMNSVMQALRLNDKLFYHCVINKSTSPLWWCMAELFAKMKYSASKTAFPLKFYYMVCPENFKNNEQQDSSEFITHLMKKLDRYENMPEDDAHVPEDIRFILPETVPSCQHKTPNKNTNNENVLNCSDQLNKHFHREYPDEEMRAGKFMKFFRKCDRLSTVYEETSIRGMFGGQYVTQIKCKSCGNATRVVEPFLELQLGVQHDGSKKSVQQLIDTFFKSNLLDGDNMYDCRICKKLVKGRISTSLEECPEYLIVNIKTYRMSFEDDDNDVKYLHKIQNSEVLKLSDGKKSYKYEQYAAVIHAGRHTESGHYFTIAKNNGRWFIFDDTLVIPIDSNGINSLQPYCDPYLLFYKRSDVKIPRGPMVDNVSAHIRESLLRK